MAQSLSNILVHLIFSTKDRWPWIRPEVEGKLYAYLAAVCRSCGCPSVLIGGTQDHVHILSALSRTATVAELLEQIKKSSSKWIKTKGPEYRPFAWQGGYAAFSIGQSNVEAVKQYIARQREHHRAVSFQEELLRFLTKYRVAYDERYLWD
jgi:REP element-mobilizing transposase RayT